jgi:SAM-dependent methyltransferase
MSGTGALSVDPTNAEQLRAWAGDEGAFWAANARRYDLAMAGYHARFLGAAAISATDTVLDIGCGNGQTTRDAARLARDSSALGVDLSVQMLAVARRLAEEEGLPNAAFEQADAQIHPFAEGAFDVVMSRTGAMFFGDRAAAFANIARALRPGGRLDLLVWQPIPRQEWFLSFTTALAAGRRLPNPPSEAPSPFSLSDPDRVRVLLTSAGFTAPRFEDLRAPMSFGTDPEDAYAFVLGQLGWMLEGLDDAGRDRAQDALQATIREHDTGAGVAFESATWLITAERL